MADPDDPVTARLAALEATLASLRAQLDEARALRDVTLRGHGRCRGCHGEVVLHAKRIMDRSDLGVPEPMAVAQTGNWRVTPIGLFEAYICAGCGLVEWYVMDADKLPVDGQVITRSEPPPPGSPYR